MTTPEIDANQLRALAERADSRRGKTVHLVCDKAGKNCDIAESNEIGERIVLLNLRTTDAEPKFEDRTATLTLMSNPVLELEAFPGKGIEMADAIFTSLVAVEKFVTRYYSQFRSPEEVRRMRDGFCT